MNRDELPVMEQLRRLNQHLLDAQESPSLPQLGRQLAQQYAEVDSCLLQGLMELRAAHLGLQAILTLLQRRDDPLLFSSEEAVVLLEPVQQRLNHGLKCFDRLI